MLLHALPLHSLPSSAAFHCSNAFGMELGTITDNQITASSSFYDERWLPRQARLNFNDNAWTPNEDSNKEYIQVAGGTSVPFTPRPLNAVAVVTSWHHERLVVAPQILT